MTQTQHKDVFLVEGLGGKKTLSGEIAVSGAKNEVLKMMAASILFEDALTIEHVPQIEDVARMCELLIELGAVIDYVDTHTLRIDTHALSGTSLLSKIAVQMRASVVLIGPLLTRFGVVSFPYPGGCVLGARPIDLFLENFEKMGAKVSVEDDQYTISTEKGLHGADIFMKKVSVTVTETLMLAAIGAKGTTTLRNAAMEPEIAHMVHFLNTCGARITGAGTPTITIEGGNPLRAEGKKHVTIPDRIETGSFLILGALAAENLSITGCVPEHVALVTTLLRDSGVPIRIDGSTISIEGNTKPNSAFTSFDIQTHEYPGFATDLQSPMVVFLTQVTGESLVFETIFESRLGWTQDLIRMNAQITSMNPQQVLVKGPSTLRGREVEGPDLRAGLAFLLAAIVAEGSSRIRNAYFIDRGYESIEERLSNIGVSISRTPEYGSTQK